MASGGYRSQNPSSSNTTDFLEEWKAKREKMRAKMYANEMATAGTADNVSKTSNEMNNNSTSNNVSSSTSNNVSSSTSNNVSSSNSQVPPAPLPKTPASNRTVEDQQVTPVVGLQKKMPLPIQDGGTAQEDSALTPQETPIKAKDKGKSCGPSARKGKGQIEKRKLREKRRSTGVVNIPSAESTDDYGDDEAGQKERKKDAVTQQNTAQNESLSIESSDWQPESVRNASNLYKGPNNAPDDDSINHYNMTDWTTSGPKDTNSGQGGSLEKKTEELEKELAKERQENVRLVKLMEDKEELIVKMKEEIDLLNRDLDDIEDENKQLKQENKTLLKVVGQLTR